jgi:hypothetical protein
VRVRKRRERSALRARTPTWRAIATNSTYLSQYAARAESALNSSDRSESLVGHGGEAGVFETPANEAGETARKRAISHEVGALLIVSGVAGILLPGPVGTPLLILGCVMIWPKAFERVDRFFKKRFPRTHQVGALQSARFLNDLERRYPVSR